MRFSTFLQIGSKLFSVQRNFTLGKSLSGKCVFLICSYYNIQEIFRETQHRALVGNKANLDNTYMGNLKFFGKILIPLILLKRLKNEVFPLLFRLVHRNCLLFGTKVNLGNTYPLAIYKLFRIILIPSNTLNLLKRLLK